MLSVSRTAALLPQTISRVLRPHKDVLAAYLFGSTATGRTHAASDVDVAVLLASTVRPGSLLRRRLELATDIGAALGRPDVDVVVLNQATPLLAHRVLSQGSLIFERSRVARVRFHTKTARLYFDMLPTYEIYIEATKRRAGVPPRGGRRG